MTHCVGLVEANEIGVVEGHGEDKQLDVITLEDGGKYVNVDMTTVEGIKRAGDLGFAQSGLADVAMTSFLFEMNNIFDAPDHRAKCFTLLRHPIKRAVSLFYYLQHASWESTYSTVYQDMTIEEYATGELCENNWMTRMLSGKMSGPLSWNHLEKAKTVLLQKCLLGFVDDIEEALDRFERYFGWREWTDHKERWQCQQDLLHGGDNKYTHPRYEEGSEVWELLKKKNGFDIMLYNYAKEAAKDQAALIPQ
uniref:Sulfotransferase domain-containing protein n=1 Tax=Trieres chinensis TaxID=1514140 RepID=A0A7S2A730_TRICV